MMSVSAIRGAVSLSLVALLLPAGAFAECGIGSKIWAGRSGTGPMLAAFTTNVWTLKAVSTTFEIMGCKESDNLLKKVASAEVRRYASRNFDRLAEDIARGDGETLDGLAYLIGVDEGARGHFQAFARRNFDVLLPHEDVTADQFLSALARSISGDHRLPDHL